MPVHLPGKVSRLIGDLRTIFALVDCIEHDMEKRIVARHVLVKIDALLLRLPELKNEIRDALPQPRRRAVAPLEALIKRLRNDYGGTELSLVRDALEAHALKLDLEDINDAWRFMCATTFGVLASDIEDIEAEIAKLRGTKHVHAGSANVDSGWCTLWRRDDWLGDPSAKRYVVIYPAIGTANVGAVLPNHAVHDVTIRAAGLATYLRQVRILIEPTSPGSNAERVLAEIMVNDYCALWELLFDSNVANHYGNQDDCVLDHWKKLPDPMDGAKCLAKLECEPNPYFNKWRSEVRDKVSAHVDPNEPIWATDLSHWPMTRTELIDEAGRVVSAAYHCALEDIRTKVLFMPPTQINGDFRLAGQEGRSWDEA